MSSKDFYLVCLCCFLGAKIKKERTKDKIVVVTESGFNGLHSLKFPTDSNATWCLTNNYQIKISSSSKSPSNQPSHCSLLTHKN